jgi:dihydrofolate reductase
MSLAARPGLHVGPITNPVEELMTKVIANLAMSIDGFIADPDGGCEELFGFYDNGGTELVLADGWPPFHMDEPSRTLMQEAVARIGCHVMGRDLYDLTNGWNGHPGNEAPIVVLTHTPPDSTPDGVPYYFFDDVEAAIARARELAGELDVAVAGGTVARQALDAGLLDVIDISLVPVVLGAGIPWFAGSQGPVRLSDPVVHEGHGVTHLRYQVL